MTIACAPLWCKSNYSFLEGASHPEELIAEAQRLGFSSIAITDRDGVYGSVRAHVSAQELGVKLIIGSDVTLEEPPDVVLALHACDTATDDAIAQAVRSGASLLLSVPCCHKHLNRSLRADGPTAVLRPVLRHGLLQQRTADIVTDSFRNTGLNQYGASSRIFPRCGYAARSRGPMKRY